MPSVILSWYLVAIAVGHSLLALSQLVSLWMWPACEDGVPCNQRKTTAQLFREFGRDVVPPLRAHPPNFSTMGRDALPWVGQGKSQHHPSRDCVEPLITWLRSELGSFTSSPSKVQQVLQYIGVHNLTLARKALGNLLYEPQDFTALVNQSAQCTRNNPVVHAYLCEALDDPVIRPEYDDSSDALVLAVHLYLVLEKLGSVGRDQYDLWAALGSHFERESDNVIADIIKNSEAEGLDDSIIKFRKQKWYSVSVTGEHQLALMRDPHHHAKVLHYIARMNILEATHVDHVLHIDGNHALGIALAADAASQYPAVDAKRRIFWPFGKDWIDSYMAWHMNYVAEFGEVLYFAKLTIPSVMCSTPMASAGDAWLAPDPNYWLSARAVTLKASIAFLANWRKDVIAKGRPLKSMSMPHDARRAWGQISLKHSNLPYPYDCCEKGSLKQMYDDMKPYDTDWSSPTSEISMEWFLFYTTMILWLVVSVTGFASEVVVGGYLLGVLNEGNAKFGWTFVQFAFPVCLTIALFSQSVFGLPFLWFGLWKSGFPEVLTYAMTAKEYASKNNRKGKATLFSLSAVGTVLHHASTSLTICSVCRGLFPLSRPLSSVCIVPVLQHSACVLKYRSKVAYITLQLVLEAYFEWEVIVNLSSFESAWGEDFTRFGRGCALGMLASHWLYLVSGAIDLYLDICKCHVNESAVTPTFPHCSDMLSSIALMQLHAPGDPKRKLESTDASIVAEPSGQISPCSALPIGGLSSISEHTFQLPTILARRNITSQLQSDSFGGEGMGTITSPKPLDVARAIFEEV